MPSKAKKEKAEKVPEEKTEKQEVTKEEKAEVPKEAPKEEEVVIDKKKQTIQFIIFAGVLVIILVGLILVPRYINQMKLDKNTYNNFQFIQGEDKFWYSMLQKGEQTYWVPFYYHPRDLENIPVETNLSAKFFDIKDNNGSIYITLDPDAGNNTIVIAGVEIARITGEKFDLLNVPTHSAFTKEPSSTVVETGIPVVTCDYASNKTMVIWLLVTDRNIVYSDGYCIAVQAKSYADIIKVADRLMYHLLGIMS